MADDNDRMFQAPRPVRPNLDARVMAHVAKKISALFREKAETNGIQAPGTVSEGITDYTPGPNCGGPRLQALNIIRQAIHALDDDELSVLAEALADDLESAEEILKIDIKNVIPIVDFMPI